MLFRRLGNTGKVFSRVGIALALVAGYRWVDAERARQTGAGSTGFDVGANRAVGNDPFRSNTLSHPPVERQDNVMAGVVRDALGHVAVAEVRGALAVAAVLHPRNHEEPIKGLDRGCAG